jgi:hypothetical protein
LLLSFFLSNLLSELLERSLALLNKSHQLTDFIEKFKCDGPNVNAELIRGAQSSCLKIDSLLELLQDRRRQLDKYLQQQRRQLAQVLQIYLWDQQENQVTQVGTGCCLGLSWLVIIWTTYNYVYIVLYKLPCCFPKLSTKEDVYFLSLKCWFHEWENTCGQFWKWLCSIVEFSSSGPDHYF